MSKLDEARHGWGTVFGALRDARERVSSAWYEVEDKQSLKSEDIRRLHNLIRDAQKIIDSWEAYGRP
mgnify:CR=1 FL=1